MERPSPPAEAARSSASPSALHEVIDAVAKCSPGQVAVEDGTASITYSELSSRSSLIARALLRQGLCPSSARPLGTLMRRGPQWMSVYAASMRCGVPVVALSADLRDGATEAQRVREAHRILAPQMLVHESAPSAAGFAGLLRQAAEASLGTPAVSVDQLLAPPESTGGEPRCGGPPSAACHPLPQVGEGALLAYCFTGGTTRASKAAKISHAMALHEVRGYKEVLPSGLRGERMRFLQNSSAYWGAALFGQLDVALAGAGAAVMCQASLPEEIAAAARRFKLTALGAVPSVLAHLSPEDMPTVQFLISWAEHLPESVAARWRGRVPLCDLLIATEYWLAFFATNERSSGSGGRALRIVSGVEVQVVLPDGSTPVACGEVGELCLSGATVFPGYADAAEDEGRFLELEGRIFFRTRDLVRWIEPQKLLEYCGRCDDMAKVGGKWVDTLALEASLGTLPGVREVKVVSCPQHKSAFVALQPLACPQGSKGDGGARQLAAAETIRRALPPGFSTYLLAAEALPRHAATGKVDRQALLRGVAQSALEPLLRSRRGRVMSRFMRGYSVLMRICRHDPRRIACLAYLWYHLELSWGCRKLQQVVSSSFPWQGGSRAILLSLAWGLPLEQLRRLSAPGAELARKAGRGLEWIVVFVATFPHWLTPAPDRPRIGSSLFRDSSITFEHAVNSLQVHAAKWTRRACPTCDGTYGVTLFPSLGHCCEVCSQTSGADHDPRCFRQPHKGRRKCDNCDFAVTWDIRYCCYLCQKTPGTHGRHCDRAPRLPQGPDGTDCDEGGTQAPGSRAARQSGRRGVGCARSGKDAAVAGREGARAPRAGLAADEAASSPEDAGASPAACAAQESSSSGAASAAAADAGAAIPVPHWASSFPLEDGPSQQLPTGVTPPEKQLPEPEQSSEAGASAEAPVSEEAVVALVARVSGEAAWEKEGINGRSRRVLRPLDSMRSLRLVAAMRQELGRSLSLQDLAACATLEELVSLVQRAPSDCRQRFPDPGKDGFRLWTFSWNNCLQWLYQVDRPLDMDAFRRAAGRLLCRHPALRLNYDGQNDVHLAFREAGVVLDVLRAVVADTPAAASTVPSAGAAVEALQEALQASWPRWRTHPAPPVGFVAGAPTVIEVECSKEEVEGIARPFRKNWTPPFQLAVFRHREAATPSSAGSASGPWAHVCVMLSHAIADGTAVEPLVQDFAALYEDEFTSRHEDGCARPLLRLPPLPHFGAVLEDRLVRTLAGDASQDAMFLDRRMHFLEPHFPESTYSGYYQAFHVLPAELQELMSVVSLHFPGCPPEVALLSLVTISLARLGGDPQVKFTLVHHGRDSPPGATGVVGFFTDFRTLTVPTSALMSLLGVVSFVFSSVRERAWRRPFPLEPIETLVNMVPSSFASVGPFAQARWMGSSWAAASDGSLWQSGSGRGHRRPLEFQIEQVDAQQWMVTMYLDEVIYPPEKGRRFRTCWQRALRELREDPLRSVLGGRPEPPPPYERLLRKPAAGGGEVAPGGPGSMVEGGVPESEQQRPPTAAACDTQAGSLVEGGVPESEQQPAPTAEASNAQDTPLRGTP